MFADIKVGDEVVIEIATGSHSAFGGIRNFGKVDKVTRTRFVSGLYTFRRNDGEEFGRGGRRGDTWYRGPRAYPLTPELRAKIKMEHRCKGTRYTLQQFCEQIPYLSRDLSKAPQDEAMFAALETALAHVKEAARVLGEVKP